MPEDRTHTAPSLVQGGGLVFPSSPRLLKYFLANLVLRRVSSGWVLLHASETQLPLLKNLPTMTTSYLKDTLDHRHLVILDVRRDISPPPDGVFVDSPVMRVDEGHHHHL